MQQGAAFGIGRGDVRHVRWLSRARSDCYASDMRQVRRLSRAGGLMLLRAAWFAGSSPCPLFSGASIVLYKTHQVQELML